MSDEIENNATPEDQPESQPEDAQADDGKVDAEDIVGEDAEMTPEEAETLAAAMAAINQVGGAEDSPASSEADIVGEDAEMTPEEAETLAAAMAAINQVQGVADSVAQPEPSPMAGADAQSFEAPEFGNDSSSGPKEGIDLLSDVHLNVRIELGRTKMYVEDVLKLSDGAVVELDKLAGDAVDVYVNDRVVAKGEVLVLNDMFCVRVSEIVDITTAEA